MVNVYEKATADYNRSLDTAFKKKRDRAEKIARLEKEYKQLGSERTTIKREIVDDKKAVTSKRVGKVGGVILRGLKSAGKQLVAGVKVSQQRAVQQRKANYARQVALYKQRVALAKRRAMAKRKKQRPVARRPIARKTIQQRQRELTRTKTPGFYNQDAERDNPYGLKSRYKMNFGQNVLTEKDPKNHVVKMNGKYKWRAD